MVLRAFQNAHPALAGHRFFTVSRFIRHWRACPKAQSVFEIGSILDLGKFYISRIE